MQQVVRWNPYEYAFVPLGRHGRTGYSSEFYTRHQLPPLDGEDESNVEPLEGDKSNSLCNFPIKAPIFVCCNPLFQRPGPSVVRFLGQEGERESPKEGGKRDRSGEAKGKASKSETRNEETPTDISPRRQGQFLKLL